MLWIALHLPDLPLQVFLRAVAGVEPLAVTEGRAVLAANPAARRLGIRPGLSLSTARALAPSLVLRARDLRAEKGALEEVAMGAGQLTPQIVLDPPDSVLLEVTGSLRLFGGLDAIESRAAVGCVELGFDPRLAHAPTPLGATLLARAGHRGACNGAELTAALERLPVRLLGGTPQLQQMLAAIGAETLGDCLHLPRAGLVRRQGEALLDILDRGLGRVPDPRPCFVPPERFHSRLELPAPVENSEALLFAARRLLSSLGGYLEARQAAVQELNLVMEHEYGADTQCPIQLAGWSRDPQRFALILREKLQRVWLKAPVTALAVQADQIQPLAAASGRLFSDAQAEPEKRALLVERLRARLGAEAVQGVRVVPVHRPERAWKPSEPGTQATAETPQDARPLWLIDPPRPVGGGALRLLAGPERIESGWWDGGDVERDYFVASGPEGQRVWVFRERRPPHDWYLHGIFA